MDLQSKVDKTFDELARHFSDQRPYFLNAVVVPTNDGRYRIAFRKDAFSDDRLILEFSFESCDSCPLVQPLSGEITFFQDEVPCVVAGDPNGANAGKVIEATRCQHFIVKNSPKALAASLVPLQKYLSDDPEKRLYGVQRNLQHSEKTEKSFPVGEYFALQPVISGTSNDATITGLTDQVFVVSPTVSPWAYAAIALVSIALLIGIAFLVRFLLRKYVKHEKTYPKQSGSDFESMGSEFGQSEFQNEQ